MSLATLAQYRIAVPGSSYGDAEAQAALDAATSLIERYCERTFTSAAYASWIDSRAHTTLCLPNYPVTILRSVCTSAEDVMSIYNTSADANDAIATVDNDSLILTVRGGVNDGTSVLTLATYATLALLGAAVTALAKGWTWAVTVECAPSHLRPGSTGGCLNATGYLQGPDESDEFDTFDGNAGMLTKSSDWPAGRAAVFADYTAGYATIPADLQFVCIQLVNNLLGGAAHAGTIQSERLGDYSYTIGTSASSTTSDPTLTMLAPYLAILDSYKRRGLQWH